MSDPTPRQRELQQRITELLTEHAAVIGPEFDGHEQGEAAAMPYPVRWLLVTEWNDVEDPENGPWVIVADSGIRWVERMGLVHCARTMIEDSD